MFYILILLLLLIAQPFTVHPRSLRSTPVQSQHLQRKFEAIQKGNETPQGVAAVAGARRYLEAFGYLEDNAGFDNIHITNRRANADDGDRDELDEGNLEDAIKKFQVYYHIKVSGKLDSETTKLMLLPRCGVPDHHHHGTKKHNIGSNLIKVTSKYAFFEGIPQWPDSKKNLTYSFESGVEVLPQEVVRDAFKVAFAQWSSVSLFTFEEVPRGTVSDLAIGFFSGEHGDGAPFDKFGPILAHAFAPSDGRLHVNADKPWSTQVPIQDGFFDLVSVAMHEIGHTLGLEHSNHPDAVMYPMVNPGVNKRELRVDDINGLKGLYSSPIVVDSRALALRALIYQHSSARVEKILEKEIHVLFIRLVAGEAPGIVVDDDAKLGFHRLGVFRNWVCQKQTLAYSPPSLTVLLIRDSVA